MVRNRLLIAICAFALASASGCGTNNSIAIAPSVPSSRTITVGSAPQTSTVKAGTTVASLSIPAASTGSGTLSITGSGTLPSGDPALSNSIRHAEAFTRLDSSSVSSVLSYITLVPSADITFASYPSFSYTLPLGTTTTNVTFELALLLPNASSWIEPISTPGVLNGANPETLVFATTAFAQTPLTLSAGQSYQFALYEVASPSATASPTPTATATATASATPLATSTPSPSPMPSPSPTPSPTASAVATATPTPGASGQPPTISGISPTSGPVGTTVVISGANFTAPISVVFSGNAAAAGNFTSTMITVTVPSGALTGPITVTAANGSASSGVFTVTGSPTPTPTPIVLP